MTEFEMPNGRIVVAVSDAQGRRLTAQGGKRISTQREYTEPTNEQLANFLVVYAKHIPGAGGLQLSPPHLELLMNNNPGFRAGALRHHRNFQDTISKLSEKMDKGELQCEYIRPNGKKCPNFNEPGRMYCGLHKSEGE